MAVTPQRGAIIGLTVLSCLFVIISTATPNWVEGTANNIHLTSGLWEACVTTLLSVEGKKCYGESYLKSKGLQFRGT